jgi:hypothetical protein
VLEQYINYIHHFTSLTARIFLQAPKSLKN